MTTGDYNPQFPQYGDAGGYPGFPPPQAATQPGGLFLRWLARIIDGLIVGVAGFLLAFFTDSLSNIWVTGLFSGLLMFVYFVAFEITQGWTPGKKVLGLSVRGANGAPKPTAKESAIRNLFTLLPIVPLVGGLLAFIAMIVIAVTISGSSTKQGKHDELAGGTQVVKR